MSAHAGRPPDEADATARRATSVATDGTPLDGRSTGKRSPRTSNGTPRSADDGSAPTANGSASSSPTSESSARRSGGWTKPRNVKQFAGQVNEIATMVLNGEIDIETARAYSSLARTVAQSVSLEVTRSRFLKEVPDLRLDE